MKKTLFSVSAALIVAGTMSVLAHASTGPTCTFTATPSTIPLGATTTVQFAWSATGTSYDGVLSPQLGALPQNGTRSVAVPGKATTYILIALSAPTLTNSVGQYALCIASVSTQSHMQPN